MIIIFVILKLVEGETSTEIRGWPPFGVPFIVGVGRKLMLIIYQTGKVGGKGVEFQFLHFLEVH